MENIDTEIINKLVEMQDELVECNIRVNELILKVPSMSNKRKIDFLDMLKHIYTTDFAILKKVRALVPKIAWENYKKLKITNLTEQELLKQAHLNLRKNWFESKAKISGRSLKNKDNTNEQK